MSQPTWTETSRGWVPVWGELGGDQPVVLAIRGAFPPFDQLADLPTPGADRLLVHLPGMHSPALSETSVAAFAAAFDEVIAARLGGRRVVALGVSTGALAALALRAPEVRAVVAAEPFLSTGGLWPLVSKVRHVLAANPSAGLAEWSEAVLGYTAERVVDRDYGPLAAAAAGRPTWVVAGDLPLLPPRPVDRMPSLVSEDDRARLRGAGAILRAVPGGHDLPGENLPAIAAAVAEALGEGP